MTTRVIPAFHRFLQWTKEKPYSVEDAQKEFRSTLLTWIKDADPEGPFFAGKEMSMVDVQMAPWAISKFHMISYLQSLDLALPTFTSPHDSPLPFSPHLIPQHPPSLTSSQDSGSSSISKESPRPPPRTKAATTRKRGRDGASGSRQSRRGNRSRTRCPIGNIICPSMSGITTTRRRASWPRRRDRVVECLECQAGQVLL